MQIKQEGKKESLRMEPTIFTILNKKPKRYPRRCYDSESLKYIIGFRVGIIAILDLCYQGYPVWYDVQLHLLVTTYLMPGVPPTPQLLTIKNISGHH